MKGKESPLRLNKNLTTIGKKPKESDKKEKRRITQLKMGEALKGWLKNEKPTEQPENPEKTKKPEEMVRSVKNMIGIFENSEENKRRKVLQEKRVKNKPTVDSKRCEGMQAGLVEQAAVGAQHGRDGDPVPEPGLGED